MDYPIVFIPGLFASIGDDVIKGTGEFSFGLAERVYGPFLDILKGMGYVEGENLYIAYYDWKKPVLESTDKYLSSLINQIKSEGKYEKLILIGHSLGGLLARAYITYFNPFLVDKLIMIGTPNLGSVNAYYFWNNGELPYSKLEDNILYDGLKLGFLLYFHILKRTDHLEVLRKTFPVVKDLLPSLLYGDYLSYKWEDGEETIGIEEMIYQNKFLNLLEKRTVNPNKIFLIGGSGVLTNHKLLVDLNSGGKIIEASKTKYGDGTVTLHSAFGDFKGNRLWLEGNHVDILYKSKYYISSILNKSID